MARPTGAKQKRRKAPERYKTRCDNHPARRAAFAFTEGSTGERRGLCEDCFEKERLEAARRLRLQRIKAKRAKRRNKVR